MTQAGIQVDSECLQNGYQQLVGDSMVEFRMSDKTDYACLINAKNCAVCKQTPGIVQSVYKRRDCAMCEQTPGLCRV